MRTVGESPGRKVKIGGAYGWVYPITPEHSDNGTGMLLKYSKLYCKYSSLTGFKYLAEEQTTWIERVLWIAAYAVALASLFVMVRNGYYEFLEAPIATTADPDYYPTYLLEFPGVTICSINRISRQSAMKLAREIFNVGISNLTFEEIIYLVQQMGDLYESSFIMDDYHEEIDQLLMKLYGRNSYVTDVMKRLTPQCSEVLLVCQFNGERRNCSDLFAFRKTQDGYCCTFNYVAEPDDTLETGYHDGTKPESVRTVKNLGITGGLTVVMDPRLDDAFYETYPIKGFKVFVLNARDYPDVTSGGVEELMVSPLTERFVEIDAISFYSLDNIRPYSPARRNCIFPDERVTQSDQSSYSYSDCIVQCRVTAIWETCGCRPFEYTRRGHAEFAQRICSTTDIPCLTRHKRKWFNILPHWVAKGFNDTLSLECQYCYPSCNDVTYSLATFSSSIEPGVYNTDLLDGLDLTEQCIVHIYFTQLGTVRLKQEVLLQWYDLLSDIGGVCSVFVGFSLISVIELLYFTTLLFLEFWSVAMMPVVPNIHHDVTTVQTIYWGELFPRARVPVKTVLLNKNPTRYSPN